MNIVVGTRCYNESPDIIHRFMRGYWWADKIVISDGGSDKSETLTTLLDYKEFYPDKIELIHFEEFQIINDVRWNPDNLHIQFVIDNMKKYNSKWIVLDDMDDVPNSLLKFDYDKVFDFAKDFNQINAFRLYLWGETEYFPEMNANFDPTFTSLWAWQPDKINIHTDQNVQHGTLLELDNNPYRVLPPYCLLHKSWHPDTIQQKIERYNAIGIGMVHPLDFAGKPTELPIWAKEDG